MDFRLELETKKVSKIISGLERKPEDFSLWEISMKRLLKLACSFFDIPTHIEKKILHINNYSLTDHLIWKYLSSLDLIDRYRNVEKSKARRFPKRKKQLKGDLLYIEPLESFGMHSYLPGSEIYLKESAYIFCNNTPYIATTGLNFFDEDFTSEISWTHKESAILMALVNLSAECRFSFFIGDFGFVIPLKENGITGKVFSTKNTSKLKGLVEVYEYVTHKIDGRLYPGDKYSHKFSNTFDQKKIIDLNRRVDRDNAVLIRCLYYFAKACSLMPHRMLLEEALALQLFSLDGVVKLLMKKHKVESFKAFKDLLEKKFNCPYADYLEELYAERTTYVHPQNNILENWCPAWDADTCFDTISIVRELIIFYLTDILKIEE